MNKKAEKIISDITKLKIQGARNVAKAALNAIAVTAKESNAKNVELFVKEILNTARDAAAARPTEPMTRNNIDELAKKIVDGRNNFRNVKDAKEFVIRLVNAQLKRMDESIRKLVDYGAKLVPEDSVVLTHCHSSTVTEILKKANKEKGIEVICCETRPLYQGRRTARELAEAGVKTTLVVDSAVNLMMKKADLVLVGADAITSRGDLINKVGTCTVAHISRFHDVSFYCAAELYKYSPLSLFGTREEIEERNADEVWEDPPKKLKIKNPAFEATAARYINGYITEMGVIPPQSLFAIATERLGVRIYK
ncbi:S-methyl-5-thioribose-1-phosphate isomerase [Candidatus Micrarchaeota archaeon]|nr:S-methyl-5-thioribose-1-phosphate isomerase [Candidatus Micrarchaeota archaeon]